MLLVSSCSVSVARSTPIYATTNPNDIASPTGVVDFSEVPARTFTPFAIAGITFPSPGITLDTNLVASPSGSPNYSTASTPADYVDIIFDKPALAVGAYFNIVGSLSRADLEVTVFKDTAPIAMYSLTDLTDNGMSFFGVVSDGSTTFTSVRYNNAANNRVSFLMDDVTYTLVPEPTGTVFSVLALALASIARWPVIHRRESFKTIRASVSSCGSMCPQARNDTRWVRRCFSLIGSPSAVNDLTLDLLASDKADVARILAVVSVVAEDKVLISRDDNWLEVGNLDRLGSVGQQMSVSIQGLFQNELT